MNHKLTQRKDSIWLSVFGGVGIMAVTAEFILYFAHISYLAFIGACIYALANPTLQAANNNQTLIIWILVTNAAAIISGPMFFFFEWGEFISVVGSLVYITNFLSMIVLFIYA